VVFARVPASSANLGPGFDTLAVALELYVEVSLESADALEITSEGFGAGLFDDERHLAVRVAANVLGHTNFKMHVNSGIPVSRGLGSSAALAVAAAAVAGATDPLAVGTEVDGHAENAAASVLGGVGEGDLGRQHPARVGGGELARP
jgi:homoserine kinase